MNIKNTMNSFKNSDMNTPNDYFRLRLMRVFAVTGMSRLELARRLNVPLHTISQWESGVEIPNVYQFREIAEYFGLPYEIFLDGTDGGPSAEELGDLLGLSEDTVSGLMKLADNAPEPVLDALDDAVFTLVGALGKRKEI